MTVETQSGGEPITKSGPYAGNGVTTTFDYDFQIQDESELLVTRQNADASETVLVLTTDYTVTGVGSDTGGTIVLVDPATDAASGTQLVIQYDGNFNQSNDYSNQGAIQLSQLEDQMDQLVMHLRQLKEIADRAVTVDAFGTADIAALRTNINVLAGIASDISTVAGISANVTSVAGIEANVTAVAGIAASVTALAAITADVTAVAAITSDVTAASAIAADISAVAGIAANVTTVAGISANVTTVAGISSAVSTVATNVADITNFADVYQGGQASDPTQRADTTALQAGDLYFNTSTNTMRVYDGAAWDDAAFNVSGALFEDTDIRVTALEVQAAVAAVTFEDSDTNARSRITGNFGGSLILEADIDNSFSNSYIGGQADNAGQPLFRFDANGLRIGSLSAASYPLDLTGFTSAMLIPVGTTAQRPAGGAGEVRFNSTTGLFEFHDGTDWVEVGAGGGVWELLDTQNPSAANPVEFTTGFDDTTYIQYKMVGHNISKSVALEFQVSDDGGTSYLTTGYTSGFQYRRLDQTTWTNGGGNSETIVGVVGGTDTSFDIRFTGMTDAGDKFSCAFDVQELGSANSTSYVSYGGMVKHAAGSFDAIRLNAVSGTITGEIKLYGLKK